MTPNQPAAHGDVAATPPPNYRGTERRRSACPANLRRVSVHHVRVSQLGAVQPATAPLPACGDAHLSSPGLEQVTDLLWGGHGTAVVTPTSAPRDWSRSPISCGGTRYSCGYAHLSSPGLEQVTDLLWGGHSTAVVTPTSAPRDWSRSPISCGEDTVQLW